VLALAIIAGVALAVSMTVLIWPWRLAIAVQARGEPDGHWALAGGAEVCGCSASLAAARGVPVVTDVRVLGRRVLRPRRSEGEETRPMLGSLRERWEGLGRWVDPADLSEFLVEEASRVSVEDVDGSVRLGLRDVALAGELAGVLAIASALAAPFGRLRHDIDWSGEERVEASLSFALRFSPARILADTARFALRSIHLSRRTHPEGT